jgi:hypothetical protein
LHRNLRAALFALSLGIGTLALAADETDWSDPQVAFEEGNKQFGFDAIVDINKKTGVPKKVAVGSFQIQYTMRTQDSDSAGSHYWVEFDDSAYQVITDALYESFVGSLVEQGYEVVPKEAVLAAEGYALLEGDEDPVYKGKKARFAASGMKVHKTLVGGGLGVKNLQTMPKLNQDLGTDSVLVVRANLGVVDVEKIKGVKKSKGVYPCLCNIPSNQGASGAYGSVDEYPGLMITWMHGVNDAGQMPGGRTVYNPIATSTVGFPGNPPLVFTEKIVQKTSKSVFSNKYGADADVLVDGTATLFVGGLHLAWAQWNADLEKKKAKLE